MFTGIITDIGTVRSVKQKGDLRLTIGCGYDMDTVDLGASIACSGACLTVVDKGEDWFAAELSQETVSKTAPGLWAEGARLNAQRASHPVWPTVAPPATRTPASRRSRGG